MKERSARHTWCRFGVLAVLTLGHCGAAHAQNDIPASNQLYEPARRPPGVAYDVLKSPHFDLIFQRGTEQEAREAAALLESELQRVEALTGHPRRMSMPVVLNDFNDQSNGLVSTLPFRQEIETAAILGHSLSARYESWLQAVMPHELVHAAQAQSDAGFGVGWLLRFLSPDLARSLNLGLPPGLNEGIAVLHESTVQEGAGRLNFSLFQMQFRAAMASEKPWSLSQMFEIPAYSYPRGRYYVGGANFVAHMAAQDGGQFFRGVKAMHYRFPFLGTGIELWAVTGKTPRRLGNEFRRAVQAKEEAHTAFMGPFTEATVLATGPGHRYRRPQWISDSEMVTHASGYDLRTGFYKINADTGVRTRIAYESVTRDANFSITDGGSRLLFSRYVRDRHVEDQWIADLFAIDIESGQTRRMTEGQRVIFPVQWGQDIWAIQHQGQFTGWVRVDESGTAERMDTPSRATVVQIAPSPDGEEAAVIMRQGGHQGIYRAELEGSGAPSLSPWIHLKDASVYDVSWNGDELLFTADPGGTANVFATADGSVVQVTRALYGAMEPNLSPDRTRLAYVEYRHERYDLVTIPWDPGRAQRVPDSLIAGPPEATTQSVSEASPGIGGSVSPYRAGAYLRPRLLLPDLLDSGNGSQWGGPLGLGPGVTIQGADPLRRWTYAVGGYHQAGRWWLTTSLSTHVAGVRTTLEGFSQPKPALVLDRQGAAKAAGLATRGLRLGLELPIYVKSNVRSTTLHFGVDGTYEQSKLFALPGDELPGLPSEWTKYQSRFTLSPSASLQLNVTQNLRDLMPNSGTTLGVQADVDLRDARGSLRRGLIARGAQYFTLSRKAHTGVRVRGTLLTQRGQSLYDLDQIAPRGYEQDLYRSTTYVGLDAEVMQPLWFVENGMVLLPVYFKVLFAYAFAEGMYGIQEEGTYRSVGAGLGVQLRLFHYVDLEFRIAPAYLIEQGRLHLSTR